MKINNVLKQILAVSLMSLGALTQGFSQKYEVFNSFSWHPYFQGAALVEIYEARHPEGSQTIAELARRLENNPEDQESKEAIKRLLIKDDNFRILLEDPRNPQAIATILDSLDPMSRDDFVRNYLDYNDPMNPGYDPRSDPMDPMYDSRSDPMDPMYDSRSDPHSPTYDPMHPGNW